MAATRAVVLVHGAWHGPWCWRHVTPLLDDAGIDWQTVGLPLTSFDDDVAATRSVLDAGDGPVVLCGHSYGGAVITEAGHHPRVDHLVYLTAFANDEGESPAATAPEVDVPTTDLGTALVIADDGTTVTLDLDRAADAFFHDCSSEDVAFALANLRPMQVSCIGTPVGAPAWRARPSTYVVCADDRAVHPELQRLMAKRCGSALEWPTSHSPFFSRPELVADLLGGLARA